MPEATRYLLRRMLLHVWVVMCVVTPVWLADAAPLASRLPAAQRVVEHVHAETEAVAMSFPSLSGEAVVYESVRRHNFYPYVYEEQVLVLVDANKQRDVRRMQRYSRMEKDGSFKLLLKFNYPESVAGTTLLFQRDHDGHTSSKIFLPSLGARMIQYTGGMPGGQILGSEFSAEDLMPEDPALFTYQREPDMVDHGVPYFRVWAMPRTHVAIGFAKRLLFIRQNNFFISRIDYFDHQGRLLKRQTRHDIHRIGGNMWRADLISEENMLNHYRSMLKIERRVYSRGYVPEELFSENRILATVGQRAQKSVIGFKTNALDIQHHDEQSDKLDDVGDVK